MEKTGPWQQGCVGGGPSCEHIIAAQWLNAKLECGLGALGTKGLRRDWRSHRAREQPVQRQGGEEHAAPEGPQVA